MLKRHDLRNTAVLAALLATVVIALLALFGGAGGDRAEAIITDVGDVDCSGALDDHDPEALARYAIALSVTQFPGCPPIGSVDVDPNGVALLFGDTDCGGAVSIVDALKIARWMLGLSVVQAPGCPPFGAIATPRPTQPGASPAAQLTVESVTVGPGNPTSVDLGIFAPVPFLAVGSFWGTLTYDPALVTPLGCTSGPTALICNPNYGADTVGFVAYSPTQLTGTEVVGSFDFQAGNTLGTSPLKLDLYNMHSPELAEIVDGSIDGSITIDDTPGEVRGHKWHDLDADGTEDAGEPRLEGITICAHQLGTGLIVCDTTDVNGEYSLAPLPPGDYSVFEFTPPDLFQTYPAGDPSLTVSPGQVVSDVNFGNADAGQISGHKWNDLDGDGVEDPGEPGLQGVGICATPIGGDPLDVECGQSDANGDYTIGSRDPAFQYLVTEPDAPFGMAQTFPAYLQGHTVGVSAGQFTGGVDFGNSIDAEIHGTKWDDLDGDGQRDPGEDGVPGVTLCISILTPPNTTGAQLACIQTDANGEYEITGLPPGSYRVDEQPTGRSQTYPAGGQPQFVVLTLGQVATGIDFGNQQAPPGEIHGAKFGDTDGDGQRDPGEQGVPGVTICLQPDAVCTTTDANGDYSFTNVPAGNHVVNEFLPAGSVNTTPISVAVAVGGSQVVTGVDFGNTAPTPPPPEVEVIGGNGYEVGGLPSVYWESDTTYTKDVTAHCGAASPVAVKLVIDFPETGGTVSQMMTNTSGEIWSATFGPFFPQHGIANLTFHVDCPPDTAGFPEDTSLISGEDEIQHGGSIYVDPSGTIVDACSGDPIAGATVTLLKEFPPGSGAYVVPDTADHIPAVNPETTAADGAYGWVVVPGTYEVMASAPGYGDATSAPLVIPPAVTDLTLALTPTAGCDSDGDGIADVDDVCPNEPEDFDGFEDDDGCPEPGVPVTPCNGLAPTIIGTNGNDVIIGTNQADVIVALAGHDFIMGLNSGDVICAGPGDDAVLAGEGNDWVDGGPGNDIILGGNGKDVLNGGDGHDGLSGGNGDDTLNGNAGMDLLVGGNGKDDCDGGPDLDFAATCEFVANVP
ncbi:MAG: SdrD B-like domain-containing protein [Dehalococcoidia bacterium]|nr:SdrD B-like domain-containing protein [Dehalococcoidia bacterium]